MNFNTNMINLAMQKATTLGEFNEFLDRMERLALLLTGAPEQKVIATATAAKPLPKEVVTHRRGRFPINHGKIWSRSEEDKLRLLFKFGMSDKDMAAELGRTVTSVVWKRVSLRIFRGEIEVPNQGDLQLNGAG